MSEDAPKRAHLRLVKNAPPAIDESSVSAIQNTRDDGAAEAAARHAESVDEHAIEALAARILHGWLRNRQQLLVPFTIDLQKLEASQFDTLLQAMHAAAHADGSAPDEVERRLKAALDAVNASAAQHRESGRTLSNPRTLHEVLAQVADVQAGALIYAASLLAIDRRKLVNRQYLRYLAARLQLPRALTRALEQRYVAAGQSSAADA